MVIDEYGNRRFYGTYRGVVTDNKDPLGKNRLRLKIPQILFEEVTQWCWGQGASSAPAIGTGVWVTFEGGDPSFPVWGGTFGDNTTSMGDLKAVLPATYDSTTTTIGVNQDAFTHLSGTATTGLEYITLDANNPVGSTALGMLAWSPIDSTPEVRVGDGTVNLQIGQEEHTRVANNTGVDIPNGVAVCLTGGTSPGDHPYAAMYIADGTVSPFRVVGVTTQVIPNGGDGLVTTRGKIHQLDTSIYTVGDILYGSPSIPGGFTTTLPSSPNDIVALGTVVTSSATTGVLLVSVTPLINQLQTNLLAFPTTTSDGTGYNQAVTSILDSRFNSTAVSVTTPSIGASNVYCGGSISDANIFVGNPGVVSVTVAGGIRRLSGSGNTNSEAGFYFNAYKRTAAGVETLMGTSNAIPVGPVTLTTYTQYLATALVTFTSFTNTDRFVLKFYGNQISGIAAQYQFQYGGAAPIRALIPAPVVTISTPPATSVSTDTTNFNHALSTADNTVQKALNTLDDSVITINGTAINLAGSATITAAPSGTASGDLTGSYPGPTLAAVGTAGTYVKVTTDSKGRITSGITTLSASDIPTPLTSNTSGNAATATKLATTITVNGTAGIDWSAGPYTFTAAAGTLTGTTLNAAVVSSSLTSVGTLTSLVSSGTITGDNFFTTVDSVAGGAVALNFATSSGLVDVASSATNLNFTTSTGYTVGSTITVKIEAYTASRTLTFPGWTFVGGVPTSLAANKIAILTVTSFTALVGGCVASWVAQL